MRRLSTGSNGRLVGVRFCRLAILFVNAPRAYDLCMDPIKVLRYDDMDAHDNAHVWIVAFQGGYKGRCSSCFAWSAENLTNGTICTG